jgi:hypothetical protein
VRYLAVKIGTLRYLSVWGWDAEKYLAVRSRQTEIYEAERSRTLRNIWWCGVQIGDIVSGKE